MAVRDRLWGIAGLGWLLATSTTVYGSDVARHHLAEGTGQAVADASGNANDGTLGDDSSAETDDPAWGTSAQAKFGGSCIICTRSQGDWVRVSDSDSLDVTGTGTVHLEAWIYPSYVRNGSYPNQYIIYKGAADGSSVNYWLNMLTEQSGFFFYTGLEFGLKDFFGTTYTAKYANCIATANTWYFVSATYNASAGTCSFYVNATSHTDSAIGSRFMVANAEPLSIGRGQSVVGEVFTTAYAFDGRIDETGVARENRPTAVDVWGLGAEREAKQVLISWHALSLPDLFGFNVLRSDPAGAWTRVNEGPIAAAPPASESRTYCFADEPQEPERTAYRLQVVALDGSTRWMPVPVEERSP